MKKRILILLSLVIVMVVAFTGCHKMGEEIVKLPDKESLSKDLVLGGYELVFEDEFEGDNIDKTKWTVGYPNKARRGGYYTDDKETVFQKDGNLVIRTAYRGDGKYGAGWYTGWVESASPNSGHNKNTDKDYKGFSSTYGYYEVRCKCPPTNGIWSAFWLMPDNALGAEGMTGKDEIGTSKDGIEVDVMESPYYQNDRQESTNIHVLHIDGYGKNAKSDKSKAYDIGDMYNTFHTYGVMWTPEEYIFYVDGVETYRTKVIIDGKNYGVSHSPEYMLLTVEIAGIVDNGKVIPGKEKDANGKLREHWAGNPNANNKSKSYDFVIDYVRVYQQVK